MFASSSKLSQSDIDQIFITKKNKELPKGLQESTLEYIIDKLLPYKGKYVDIENIAVITNLSKVSLRKYLDYLTEKNDITKRIDYGTVGRPKYKYYIK